MATVVLNFTKKPPKEAPHAISDRITSESKKTLQFYECRGTFQVVSAMFISKSPWLIPISIEDVNPAQINELPLFIQYLYITAVTTLGDVQLTQKNIFLQL